MKDAMNLQQIIYSFLSAQIEFGACRKGDPLPSIEEASLWLSVSIDTVRSVYLRMKKEGLITLAKKAGAAVAVDIPADQIEQNIQAFFSLRREAVIDLCRALDPVFSHIQWLAMKNASPEQLDALERLCEKRDISLIYKMTRQTMLIYGTLNNDLLLRLVWQAFMFFQGPFLSLPQNTAFLELGAPSLLTMTGLCRRKDWIGLWQVIEKFQTQFSSAIRRFYEDRITMKPDGEPVAFHWNAYKKSSQYCYSLAIGLLKDIRHGIYPEEEFLPSPQKLAEARQVSVITIRRTLALLNQLGATESVNGVGTRVLRTEDSTAYCDFSRPLIQKRLADFAQSLHILALTCKGVAKTTLDVMDAADIGRWKERLLTFKRIERHEAVLFASLEVLSRSATLQSVREIYVQLLQILLWGYPLRGIHGSREAVNAFYLPHIDTLIDCLERRDSGRLAAELETLLYFEVKFAVTHLIRLGIIQVSGLVLPDQAEEIQPSDITQLPIPE